MPLDKSMYKDETRYGSEFAVARRDNTQGHRILHLATDVNKGHQSKPENAQDRRNNCKSGGLVLRGTQVG